MRTATGFIILASTSVIAECAAQTLFGLLCFIALMWPVAGRSQANVDYAAPSSWLCWPGRSDACSSPLTTTVVSPQDGALTKGSYVPNPAAPIDCFYVYPTVSLEKTPNADLALDPEEIRAVVAQFARFGAKCRTFAPLYRQTTVAALDGEAKGADYQLPYTDVLNAWRSYLALENHGRGFVLIGHSQGSKLLARLIAEEIDGKPIAGRMVSAILPGTDIQVPVGRDVGATFRHVPLCRTAVQVGCVIAYSSYLATDPPGPDARFGASEAPTTRDACVNPGALTADGTLNAELPTRGEVAKALRTDFVENPGLLIAACTTANDRTYLSISIKTGEVGTEGLTRALSALGARAPGWGLHALDVNLGLGDLVEIVGRQGQAYTEAHR